MLLYRYSKRWFLFYTSLYKLNKLFHEKKALTGIDIFQYNQSHKKIVKSKIFKRNTIFLMTFEDVFYTQKMKKAYSIKKKI